jgi:hypothetical protein
MIYCQFQHGGFSFMKTKLIATLGILFLLLALLPSARVSPALAQTCLDAAGGVIPCPTEAPQSGGSDSEGEDEEEEEKKKKAITEAALAARTPPNPKSSSSAQMKTTSTPPTGTMAGASPARTIPPGWTA